MGRSGDDDDEVDNKLESKKWRRRAFGEHGMLFLLTTESVSKSN